MGAEDELDEYKHTPEFMDYEDDLEKVVEQPVLQTKYESNLVT